MKNEERIAYIKKKYGNSSDIVIRKLNDNLSYIYLESVASDDKISDFINKSLLNIDTLFKTLKNSIFSSHIEILSDINSSLYYLSSGYTILFVNNENSFIAIETKSKLDRGINESNSEPIIRGPKDSFTENHSTNIGLIRKRIKDNNLYVEDIKIGTRTNAKVSLIYINDIVNKKNIRKLKDSLNKINVDAILDIGYIRDFLENSQRSFFPKMISTERPDFTCQELLNGKIVIMVENNPYVLIMPAVLSDFFKSSEDYYQKPTNSTFNRILKWIAFFITIFTPAIYISLMTFNQEMIPDQLLISLATQRNQVPFPTFLEVIIYVFLFEILREADIKSPSANGASMSIVGALILGDASVAAGLVSPFVIIVVAITSICELVFTDMDFINAIREWRILFIISTIFTGLIGVIATFLLLIIQLSSIETLDTPYLTPIAPLHLSDIKELLYVIPANKRKNRPSYLTQNRRRLKND